MITLAIIGKRCLKIIGFYNLWLKIKDSFIKILSKICSSIIKTTFELSNF